MTYYEAVREDEFIGIGTTNDLRKVQAKHGILVYADESDAQYIDIGGTLYRDNWFTPVTSDRHEYETATITVIGEETYETIKAAIEEDGEILFADEDYFVTTEEAVIDDDLTALPLEYAKERKTRSMSADCKAAIAAGVDVTLSDGETHHFSLTVEDQLNLIALPAQAVEIDGAEVVPYHADGELCTWYTLADHALITAAAGKLKLYHTTYFNSLKHYISSFDSVADVAAVYYGMEIPEDYQSDILKRLLSKWTAEK